MKYKCDVVKDLMPLCLDHEATKASEQTVIEHLAECKECATYYEALDKDVLPTEEKKEFENNYRMLAERLRKRKITRKIFSMVVIALAWCVVCICLAYAAGYRTNSRAAVELSGKINGSSELLGCYEWKEDRHFYFYESMACYDVVAADRSVFGWKQFDFWLNWPKWSLYDGREGETGIDVTGDMCHYRNDEGVQLFPVMVHDERVKTVEVTCYGKTETKEILPETFTLFTFDAVDGQSSWVEAVAYDENGKVIYRYDKKDGYRVFVPVEE